MYFREPQTDETARRFKTGFKSSGLESGIERSDNVQAMPVLTVPTN